VRELGERFGIGPERVRQLLNHHVRQATGLPVDAKAMSRAATAARRAKDLALAQARGEELLAAWRAGEKLEGIASRASAGALLPSLRARHPHRRALPTAHRAPSRSPARPPGPGGRAEPANARPSRTAAHTRRTRSRRPRDRARHRGRRAATSQGAPAPAHRRTARQRQDRHPAHLPDRRPESRPHGRGLRNVRKSGDGGNRTHVRNRVKMASTSVAGALISSRVRLAGGVARDQPPMVFPAQRRRASPGEPTF
jgi:hypothetical protein